MLHISVLLPLCCHSCLHSKILVQKSRVSESLNSEFILSSGKVLFWYGMLGFLALPDDVLGIVSLWDQVLHFQCWFSQDLLPLPILSMGFHSWTHWCMPCRVSYFQLSCTAACHSQFHRSIQLKVNNVFTVICETRTDFVQWPAALTKYTKIKNIQKRWKKDTLWNIFCHSFNSKEEIPPQIEI